jgi:hypothetical protein
MCGRDTTPEERKRGAIVLATLLYGEVQSQLPGKWRVERNPDAIDHGRSGSIIEFRLGKWPPRFRLSIHSDDGSSLLDYGVFRPTGMNRQSNDEGLREYLAASVPGNGRTDVHWAWYRNVDGPLRDFSRQETLIEVEKIRRREESKGDDAFRRASDHLARLAKALDGWYSRSQPNASLSAAAPPPVAIEPR